MLPQLCIKHRADFEEKNGVAYMVLYSNLKWENSDFDEFYELENLFLDTPSQLNTNFSIETLKIDFIH